MNRGYISTPCPSELILVIKMTSSEVLPAHAGPMTSASTATHGGALSLAPAPGPPPRAPRLQAGPHTSPYRWACSASPSAMPRPARRVKVSSSFRAVPYPSVTLVLRPHGPRRARRCGGRRWRRCGGRRWRGRAGVAGGQVR